MSSTHPRQLTDIYSQTQGARKIIVVDLGFLGDTVHLIPALWELKSNYPDAELHVLTSRVGAEVLDLALCVDKAWALELARDKRSIFEHLRVLKQIRRDRFDLAINFSGADRALFITALTGARSRVAYPGGRQHFYNRLLAHWWTPAQDANKLVYEQRRQVLADCGLKLGPSRFDLRIPEKYLQWAASIAPEPVIHISPNSAKAAREWPLEHHARMLAEVWDANPEVFVLASSSAKVRERERLCKLSETVKDDRLKILPDNLSIPQLAAVLARCRLHLGPDSGVLHLAVALNVPTVSFFREQGAYKSFMPEGPRHKVISMACICVDHYSGPCERQGWADCFAKIEPSRVARLVVEQLAVPA